jgi:hypothetical protein
MDIYIDIRRNSGCGQVVTLEGVGLTPPRICVEQHQIRPMSLIVFFLKRFKKRIEAVEKTPRTDVAQLREGPHAAVGTSVALDKPLVSPLT